MGSIGELIETTTTLMRREEEAKKKDGRRFQENSDLANLKLDDLTDIMHVLTSSSLGIASHHIAPIETHHNTRPLTKLFAAKSKNTSQNRDAQT